MANGIKIGWLSFDSLKIGNSDVDAAYIGDTLVYSGSTPTGVTCNDLVLPDGDSFKANTTDKGIQIPYSGVSSNDITVVECGYGYLEFDSIDSNYIYLDIVNSPKDGDSDCINIRINGDKCTNVYVYFYDSGGGLEQIPMFTDMTQYYGRYIKRIVINDTTVPNGETSINQAWVGDFIYFNWGAVMGGGQFQSISSLPIDFTPTNPVVLSSFIGLGSTHNPFNDLQIEWV